jgi:hypothetical protein
VTVHHSKKGARDFDVTIFHQKNNPQTSVGSVFSGLKQVRNIGSFIFSQKGLAVLAFALILFVFLLNTKMLCGDIKPDPTNKVY